MPSRRGLLRLLAAGVGTFAGCSTNNSTDAQTTELDTETTVTTTRISTPNRTSAVTTTAETTDSSLTSSEAAAEAADSNGTATEMAPTTTAQPTTVTNATTTATTTTTAAPTEEAGGSAGGGSGGGGSSGGGSGSSGGGGGSTDGDGSTDGGSEPTDDDSTGGDPSGGGSTEPTPTEKTLPDTVTSYPEAKHLTVAPGDYELVGFEVTSAQVFTFIITTDEDRDFDLYGTTAEQVQAYEDQLFRDGGSFEAIDTLTEQDSNGEAWGVNEHVTGTYYFIIDNTPIGSAATASESLTVDVWLRTDPYGDKV